MAAVMEQEAAIFETAGQAVHVAFLIMAQEATQDAPLRKALIRVMESIKLDSGNQRDWLDQLRGERGAGTVNFEGLSPGDIRAQCALITQAVTTNLPPIERWVLQAKYGQTDFEDIVEADESADSDGAPLEDAIEAARGQLVQARAEMDAAGRAFQFLPDQTARGRMIEARGALGDAQDAVAAAESAARTVQAGVDQVNACRIIDNGRAPQAGRSRRRWAFSAERIVAIKGLSDWFAPMFPRIKPLAVDCMLGMLYANHKKIDISTRDLAAKFGGSHMSYYRASCRIRTHLRTLEESALARLEPAFTLHGVSCAK
jgi:hypothetical protein